MRFTVLRKSFAVLLALVAGCGYDSTTPYTLPDPAIREGLWTASAADPAVIRLAPNELLSSGNHSPSTTILTSSAALGDLNGVAFDTDGTMWVTSQADSMLVAFSPTALAHSGITAATIAISSTNSSLSAPVGLAFDRQHRLWVANSHNGTVVRFDPAQLSSSGSPVPSVIISGLGQPAALAFDASGSLWVSDIRRNKLASFSEAQITTSGFLAPQVVISSLAASIANPGGIAFDTDGNLWVANITRQNVIAFSPAQLATTGTPAPHITISAPASSPNVPVGLAFDAAGALWVVDDAGELEKFPKTSLAATGAPAPSIRVTVPNYTLFWSAAFWPKPAGLPLN